MKLLLIDSGGFMLDYALRAQEQGHTVRWFIRRVERTKDIGRGCLHAPSSLVDVWQDHMKWADLVILGDNVKYLRELDSWREHGTPIIGPSVEAAQWELNRTSGQDLMKKCGLPVADYKEFHNYDQAIAYVKKEQRPFVSKPLGDEADKSLTYVSKSPADMVYMLERWKSSSSIKHGFMLQELVTGTEMAVGGWFGPHGFNKGWCENWEFKKLMAGDTGPATGEMGTVVRVVNKSLLADKVLKPFEDELHKINYVGYIDVNCIIDDKGQPWPLEFTMRPGWPLFNIQTGMLKGDVAEWLADLSDGVDASPFENNLVAVGVVMAIPDFPFSLLTRKLVTGIPIYQIKPWMKQGFHPCELMQGKAPHNVNGQVVEKPCLVTAGDYVCVATGFGTTVRKARTGAYRMLKTLEVPNSPFWRPDIGLRLKDQLPEIQRMGYAQGLDF